jgi:hypothetical protein
MLKDNYDLNIWDKLGYDTEYQEEGWCISVYTIPQHEASYGSGEFLANIYLAPHEARRLTLGMSEQEGGFYTSDPDFWIDAQTFLDKYTDMPRRIKRRLSKLMEGELDD